MKNNEEILETITPEQWKAINAISAERMAKETTEPIEVLIPKLEDINILVTDLLRKIGAKPNIKGYRYLREAVILVYKNWNYMDAITKELYPDIAKKFNTTASRVERAIRHSIEVIFLYGDIEVLATVFSNSSLAGKVTNSEAIAYMVEYLKHN